MSLASLVAYSLALGIAAAIPGPGVVALVARALGSGFSHGFAFALGLVLGDLTYLAAACFGLALIAEAFGEAFVVVRYAAALYLGYIAWKLWKSAGDGTNVGSNESSGHGASFAAGYLVTLSNPKTIVFYLALLPTLLDLSQITARDFMVLVAATTLVLLLVMTPYAAVAARARGVLRKPKLLARLNRCAAAILAGSAVWAVMRRA